MDYTIRLQTMRPYVGAVHWWFTCPLLRLERACNYRVSKPHLPPGSRYYGCRHCYDLTYQSCQQSDKRVSFLRKHPKVLMALLDGLLQSAKKR
jgi:hypothetical protein